MMRFEVGIPCKHAATFDTAEVESNCSCSAESELSDFSPYNSFSNCLLSVKMPKVIHISNNPDLRRATGKETGMYCNHKKTSYCSQKVKFPLPYHLIRHFRSFQGRSLMLVRSTAAEFLHPHQTIGSSSLTEETMRSEGPVNNIK